MLITDSSNLSSSRSPGSNRGQVIRFIVIGAASGALYLAVLIALETALPVIAASVAAYCVAMAFNYLCQRAWTFKSNRVHRQAIPRYVAVHMGGMLLNGGALHFLTQNDALPLLPAQAVAIVLVAIWSFLFQKLWVFAVKG